LHVGTGGLIFVSVRATEIRKQFLSADLSRVCLTGRLHGTIVGPTGRSDDRTV